MTRCFGSYGDVPGSEPSLSPWPASMIGQSELMLPQTGVHLFACPVRATILERQVDGPCVWEFRARRIFMSVKRLGIIAANILIATTTTANAETVVVDNQLDSSVTVTMDGNYGCTAGSQYMHLHCFDRISHLRSSISRRGRAGARDTRNQARGHVSLEDFPSRLSLSSQEGLHQ